MTRSNGLATQAAAAPSPFYPKRRCACGGVIPEGASECAACARSGHVLQKKPDGSTGRTAEPTLNPSSGGRGLPERVRRDMENRFAAGFSDVRIHDDPHTHKSAFDLSARAYTVGSDIYFAKGQYRADSGQGLDLLAHELVHVMQQRSGRVSATASQGLHASSAYALEREAEAVEKSFHSRASTNVVGRAPFGGVQRNGLGLSEIREFVGGSIESVANRLLARYGDRVPELRRLDALRRSLSVSDFFEFTAGEVQSLRRTYEWMRSKAPSWLRMPNVDFTGVQVQRAVVAAAPLVIVGGITLTLGQLLL
ncbi:MAG TPA: DUF4157 domain-containing protein, partial [Gemmatimonadaceae bacterium]|nr:DUF4157 domain-containing protein [Gemmatimonadaceae bacterium]